jgi:four helix bundle protein
MTSENPIVEISFEFALAIIEYADHLESQKKFVLAQQVLRAGTSIGANIKESQAAESRADFIHKLKIASKEADETEYWLLLCKKSKNFPDPDPLFENLLRIKKLLSKIIATSKKNLPH